MTSPYAYPNGLPPVYGSPQHQPGQPYTMPPGGDGSQQQPAGPAQGQGIVPPMPTLGQGSGGGSVTPKLRHLIGRTIIVEPVRVDETATDQAGKPRPEAYFHLTVVDGGPLKYADNQSHNVIEQHPPTREIDTPCRFVNANDYGQAFVKVCRDALAAGEVGRVGVVQYGTLGNKPPLITKCNEDVHGNPRSDGDARYAAAMELFGKIWADKHAPAGAPRQFISPEPRNLAAPPSPAQQSAPPVNYGVPQSYPAAPPQAPGAYPHPYGGAQPTGAAPAYGYQPQPAPAPPVEQLPPAVEQWLTSLPEDQRAAQRAAFLQHQAQQQAAAAAPPPAYAGPGI